VDTIPHAYCVPGTTRTNNTAFLLYGSGLNKTKGRTHNETKSCNNNNVIIVLSCLFMLMGVESSKANGRKLRFFLIYGWTSIWLAVMAWLFGLVCHESEEANGRKLRFPLIFGWTSIWLAVVAWLFGLVCQISDWLNLYRAIDEPALRDVLAWDDFWAWRCSS
jgi:hypothetical protein